MRNPVPFSHGKELVERGLLNAEGGISGRAQSAVRSLSAPDFNRIISLGLAEDEPELPRVGQVDEAPAEIGLEEGLQAPFQFEQERTRVTVLTSRPVRDRLSRHLVLRAYDKRCAITGLKLINGGGRAEVDAAHIRAVEHNGPDILSNGIALSGTAHWMFDRGLIGLSDNLEILVSRHVNDPESVRGLINPTVKRSYLVALASSRILGVMPFADASKKYGYKTGSSRAYADEQLVGDDPRTYKVESSARGAGWRRCILDGTQGKPMPSGCARDL